jgi:hypothetical protein
MKWCCDGFRYRYELRHERGLIVFARPPVPNVMSEPLFYIGFRALERSKHENFSQVVKKKLDGSMSLSGCIGFRFCPWCGVELGRFYRTAWEELVDQKVIDEFVFPQ